jgi:hypothetical protein
MVLTFRFEECDEFIGLSRFYRADIHRSGVYVDLEQVFTSSLYIYWVYSRFYFFLSFFCGNLDSIDSAEGIIGKSGAAIQQITRHASL